MSREKQRELDMFIDALNDQRVVEPVETSAYSSAAFLVTNSDKSKRLLVAYNAINKKWYIINFQHLTLKQ